MADLGDLKDRITNALDRDVASEDSLIQTEILAAIEHFKQYPFRFNRKRFEFLTVADQKEYGGASTFTEPSAGPAIPASDIYDVIRLRMLPTGTNHVYRMKRVDSETIDLLDGSGTSTRPWLYDWEAEQLILYPTPSASGSTAKGVCIRNVSTIDSSSNDSAGSDDPWLNEAVDLTFYWSLRNIYATILETPEKFILFEDLANREFRRMQSLYHKLYFSDTYIAPWHGPGSTDRGYTRWR